MSYLTEIYAEPIYKKYYSSSISVANWIRLNCKLISLLLPLILSIATYGFWQKTSIFREQPKITYTHEHAFFLENVDSKETFYWTSLPILNELLPGQEILPNFEYFEDDFDKDKKVDNYNFNIAFNFSKNFTVQRLQYFIVFNVSLDYRINFNYQAVLRGDIDLLRNCNEIKVYDIFDMFDLPIILPIYTNETGATISLNEFKNRLRKQNYELNLKSIYAFRYSTECSSSNINNVFNIEMDYSILDQIISYRSNVIELVKWAFIQYIAFAILIRAICHQLIGFLCRNHYIAVMDENLM
uniref:Transmembrane protein 231 n=1 Tax=Rhabditophanes sp. KR3021 TaxID=114890 RepID=A0AC35TN04_9BILA